LGVTQIRLGQLLLIGPSPGNDPWNLPLILPILFSETVDEFSLLEHQHHVSRREQPKDEDIHPFVVDDERVGNGPDTRAEVPRMSYHPINSILQQSAPSMLRG
jgi:hypothetical protein